jgi:uncharacterized protein
MKTKNILAILALIVFLIIVFYSFQGGRDDADYHAVITRERQEKDRFMKTAEDSPLRGDKEFMGLNYYPPDAKFKIIADVVPVENKKVVILRTNDGNEQRYLEYAYADFILDGVKNRLLMLEMIDMGPSRGKLFLAFGDETSAVETYGAGRYLDVNKVPGATTITLDFNKAYNPYCAYNDAYSCPLPPAENLLRVAIRAGEKNFHQ